MRARSAGMECWNGSSAELECWNGVLEWSAGLKCYKHWSTGVDLRLLFLGLVE